MALLTSTKNSRATTSSLAKKANKKPATSSKVRGGVGAIQRIISIAESKLSKYKDKYETITTVERLQEYINLCNTNGIAALDTETTGLDVFTIDIAGICLYTPGAKAAYVPINHCSYVTKVLSKNQLTKEEVKECFKTATTGWVMHNADYDIRVMHHTLDITVDCYWDTMIGAKMLDENAMDNTLKGLHMAFCDSQDDELLSFGNLFSGVVFTDVPVSVAYLYAAGDAVKTFELYEYQKRIYERACNKDLYNVFINVEMPLVRVIVDMEDTGIAYDFKFSDYLVDKYTKKKEDVLVKVHNVIAMYAEEITNYKMRNVSNKLSDPINLGSPTQLATLLYDILGCESTNKKSPRGTGEEVLKELAKGKHKNLCESILELRGVEKLLSTYVLKMPELARRDGRVHARFNQLGAKTGRFSSSDPNLQNIPSRNKEIRQMFYGGPGMKLISADYSKQEVFIAASISGDKEMMKACESEDIYSQVAAQVYNTTYEECLEFRPDGTTNYEGKARRAACKAIVLGVLYSKEVPSIATDLGISKQEAQKAYDSVLKAFPKLKQLMHDSQDDARTRGYVETAWGRRRRLPDMQLEKYDFSLVDGTPMDFDPLSFDSDEELSTEVPQKTKAELTKKLDKAFGFIKKQQIIQDAKARGIKIKDNGAFIAQAERQCVNSRVQGSAADVTKVAMILIHKNPELRALGYKILVPIHDELLGQCPAENVDRCSELVEKLMIEAGAEKIKVPMKVDVSILDNWK